MVWVWFGLGCGGKSTASGEDVVRYSVSASYGNAQPKQRYSDVCSALGAHDPSRGFLRRDPCDSLPYSFERLALACVLLHRGGTRGCRHWFAGVREVSALSPASVLYVWITVIAFGATMLLHLGLSLCGVEFAAVDGIDGVAALTLLEWLMERTAVVVRLSRLST